MLKRILFFAFTALFATAIGHGCRGLAVIDSVAMAQTVVNETVVLKPPITGEDGNGLGLEGIIKNITGFIFWLGIVICPILIVWGGFNIATAAGSEDKMKKGRDTITYAAIGLVIIAISSAMVTAIQNILK